MSIFDENIEPKFEDLLESLDWFKTERFNSSYSYIYSGLDCESRYFSIEFFPKGYIYEDVSENYDDAIVKKLRKDRWHIYYQHDCSKLIGYHIYVGQSYDIRMDRENVIQLMNDIKNRTFNLGNYKVIKKMK